MIKRTNWNVCVCEECAKVGRNRRVGSVAPGAAVIRPPATPKGSMDSTRARVKKESRERERIGRTSPFV